MLAHRRFLQIISMIVVFTLLFSSFSLPSVSAQGGDGLQRQINPQTGKVSFIGSEDGRVLSASRVLGTAIRPQNPAMALARRFGPEFGLRNPERELTEMKTNRPGDGRLTVRYQQNHQGIPVMGGELIVNTNENGDLYSINGEVSPDLSLSTQSTIDSEQARQTALQVVAKWYQKSPNDFSTSDPKLWVYDESLLKASIRPAELVWRMEVTPNDLSMPVRELVLVNAQRGNISLHFNQVDTAWTSSAASHGDLMPALLGGTWYVATTGNNSNSCSSAGSPCATIDGALGKAAAGDVIRVAVGTYTGTGSDVVSIALDITLSGGWNAGFTAQTGTSTIDGQGTRRGMLITAGVVTVDRFTIQNGYAASSGAGGGILNTASLTLSNSVISDNHSESWGGGIYNDGTLVVNTSTIRRNGASAITVGGGLMNDNGATATLNNSTVSDNGTSGVYVGTGIHNRGTLTLNGSTVNNNNTGYGINDDGTSPLTLNNSTISGNYLGGISKVGGTLNISSSTITGNWIGIAPDIGVNATIRNSIVAGNTIADCSGPIVSAGYNLIGTNKYCSFTAAAGDQVGTSTNAVNPLLKALQNNGGPTWTHTPLTGSPALNTGNPATPGSGGNACLAADQRGVARPIGGRCDIGATEGSAAWGATPQVSTYTANNGTALPGTFVCNQTNPTCSNGDAHAKAAHKYAIGTYYLYATQHGRNSINNAGMPMISSVHYDAGYNNAFWSGTQMVYGDAQGYAMADDVVAHELTHGVTERESNLFYYYQSGAINESFSDVWGEFYDQTNDMGNDDLNWSIGEDITGNGTLRYMDEPTSAGDPDKVSSPVYYTGSEDNGGVHTNSGINNKAVFLMVAGGDFNGKMVSSLGWAKTIAIYYHVNTNLLTSGADYSDLYYALQTACSSLTGQKGITAADCAEVKDAIDAVEMNGQPAANFNTDAPLCAAGSVATMVFTDNLEAGTANWTFSNGGHPRWQWDSPFGPFAQSGLHSLYADDFPAQVTDATARLKPLAVPANAFLYFAQAYGFEVSDAYYDGGVLEYSTNNGASWADAGSLINFNGYQGVIFTGAGNPLSGRNAFVGSSHGYISTRLNLASLAGQTVNFRWRMGLDQAASDWGWWVDSVKLYTCTPMPGAFNKVAPANGAGSVSLNPTLSWNSSSAATSYQYCYDLINDNQCNRAWISTGGTSAPISNLGPNTTYYWQVKASNLAGTTVANSSSWSSFTTTSTLPAGTTGVNAFVENVRQGSFSIATGQSLRESFVGINNGPVRLASTTSTSLIGAERVIYKVQGVNTSFLELMGLPDSQVDTTYWLPWYNNVDLDTQLRIANTTNTPATVTITIGGVPMPTLNLTAGESTRVSYAGVNNGPVQIVSSQNIIATERVIYKVGGVNTSYSEMNALPNSQVDTTYWLPWYNNVDLDTQLRIANVSNAAATVHVFIGNTEVTPVQGITMQVGESQRLSYAGVNNGPVKIVSNQNIVAAERVIYKVNNIHTSFTEMMALPNGQLDTTYWLPWYNNVDLDTQLRFANVGNAQTTVHIYVGGIERGSGFILQPNESTRISFSGLNAGPVQIVSESQLIVVAERVIYKVNNIHTSFTEMMALPDVQLDTIYWFPWYNNVDLDTQLRFGVP